MERIIYVHAILKYRGGGRHCLAYFSCFYKILTFFYFICSCFLGLGKHGYATRDVKNTVTVSLKKILLTFFNTWRQTRLSLLFFIMNYHKFFRGEASYELYLKQMNERTFGCSRIHVRLGCVY